MKILNPEINLEIESCALQTGPQGRRHDKMGHESTTKQVRLAGPPRRLIDSEISIEISPDEARNFTPDARVLPLGSRIFLPHLPGKPLSAQVVAAELLKEMGYAPVPHFGARNFASVWDFVHLLESYSRIGVNEGLFLGGNPPTSIGPFMNAAELLAHPVLSNSTIKIAHVGGYPEGHPAVSDNMLRQAFSIKRELCTKMGLELRVISQFGFDGEAIGAWARTLQLEFPGTPIRLGLAGVTTLPKLIRFAVMCGVGPSLSALRRSSAGLLNALTEKNPGDVMAYIEAEYPRPTAPLDAHFFVFGGWRKTLDWISAARSTSGV